MLKGLGLAFISIMLASLLWLVAARTGSEYLSYFARNTSVEVTATILALNVATATFLVGGLLSIEEKVKANVFDGPRREIQQNLLAMAFLFVLNLAFVSAMGPKNGSFFNTELRTNDLLSIGAVGVTLIFIYLMIEIVRAVFKMKYEAPKK